MDFAAKLRSPSIRDNAEAAILIRTQGANGVEHLLARLRKCQSVDASSDLDLTMNADFRIEADEFKPVRTDTNPERSFAHGIFILDALGFAGDRGAAGDNWCQHAYAPLSHKSRDATTLREIRY